MEDIAFGRGCRPRTTPSELDGNVANDAVGESRHSLRHAPYPELVADMGGSTSCEVGLVETRLGPIGSIKRKSEELGPIPVSFFLECSYSI